MKENNSQDIAFFFNNEIKENTRKPIEKTRLTPKQVILTLLKAKAWKQVDLAGKIGISPQGLNNYISGRWAVPTQIKIKIAEALDVDSSVIWDLEK